MATIQTKAIRPPHHFVGTETMGFETSTLMEEYAFRYGRGYDSYLAVEPDREYFWGSEKTGLVSFARRGKYIFVIGGLLAPEEHWDSLVQEFVKFCQQQKLVPTVFNIDETQLPPFRKWGFQITKVGENTVIDLENCTWRGKPYEWVRRQSNFCRRKGLVAEELLHESANDAQWSEVVAELESVSDQYLKTKPHGRHMKHFVARFNPSWLRRRRMFFARDADGTGRIEGFIICNPSHGGRRWSIETSRFRPDATRGVIPYLMHHAMQTFQNEGRQEASLCMVPCLRCDEPLPGDSGLVRRFLSMAGVRLGVIYDIHGMYHFRSRFRPSFQNTYMAVYPKATLWSLRAALKLWGADHINFWRVGVETTRRLLKRSSRKSLIRPDEHLLGERQSNAAAPSDASETMTAARQRNKTSVRFNSYPFWAPRFWTGMRLGTWMRLLARHRFIVRPYRISMALGILVLSVFSSILAVLQNLLYGRKLSRTQIDQAPIFVIGHWRSGTTLLHELLSLDDRFVAPSTYAAFNPNHFLLTESVGARFFSFLMPSRRPMDDVPVGMSKPQEDEWALCNMGIPSPYLRTLFPNTDPPYMEYLDMAGVSAEQRQKWSDGLARFLKMLTLRHGKRIVLKSPPHTGRLPLLLKMFPEAKFIHVVRNPHEVFVSTMRMWQAFDETQGLRRADEMRRQKFVLDVHKRLYTSFHKHRSLLAPNQLCEIRYEELIDDPVGEMQRVYDTLELGEFEVARPHMQAYMERISDYTPNRHEIPRETREIVSAHWGEHIDRYGYSHALTE